MQRTVEQEAIRKNVQSTKEHLLIDARAGAGKTTSVLDALEVIPAPSTLLLAFNKRIQVEMEERLPPIPKGRVVVVKTLHAVGLKVLRDHFPHLQVPDRESNIDATEELITEAWGVLSRGMGGGSFGMPLRRCAVRLLKTIKDVQAEPTLDGKTIREIGIEYQGLADFETHEMDTIVQVIGLAYEASKNFHARKWIDYPDMVWGPVVAGLKPKSRYKAIIVDEAQDVADPQMALIESLLAPDGRLILVGDPRQGIYGWRGAKGDSVWKTMLTKYKATRLGLTITWRCPVAVVKLANQLVPDLKARPNAPAGSVRTEMFDKAVTELSSFFKGSTFVLARANAPLLRVALELWKRNVRFTLNGGRDIIYPLLRVVEKLDWKSTDAFKKSAETWFKAESDRAEKAGSAALAERAEQIYNMILVAIEYAGAPSRVKGLLHDVLGTEHKSNITLSTVHKVKGLEADRVFLIKETFQRHRKPDPKWGDWRPKVDIEELNIEYVAITRAKQSLTWIEFPEDALSIIVRNRLREAIEEAAFKALDQCPDGEEKDLLVAQHYFGDDVTRNFDGSIHVPARDIGRIEPQGQPDFAEFECDIDPNAPIDGGEYDDDAVSDHVVMGGRPDDDGIPF